jgi:hypothetical protein
MNLIEFISAIYSNTVPARGEERERLTVLRATHQGPSQTRLAHWSCATGSLDQRDWQKVEQVVHAGATIVH